MRYEIKGETTPILEIELEKGETILSEPGRMIYKETPIEMKTKAEGGMISSLKRSFSGESFFLTEFSAESNGLVHFAPKIPGAIRRIDVKEDSSVLAQEDAIICTINGNIDVGFNSDIAGGFLGGEGFKFTKMDGPETAFIEAGGEVQKFELEEGQKLEIDTGCLVAYEDDVKVSAEKVGGVKNSLFGGEGLFLTTAEGPGKVWVQSMSLKELALELDSHIPGN